MVESFKILDLENRVRERERERERVLFRTPAEFNTKLNKNYHKSIKIKISASLCITLQGRLRAIEYSGGSLVAALQTIL